MSEESGEDAPSRPKRKIKKVMVLSSSSGSDSDESVGAVATRKKRLRVVSDGEASDSSSGSSVAARRRRKLPMLRDSDAESDSSGWATDRSGAARPAVPKPAGGFASDSSEGNSDKCSICLLRFTDQQIGTPENCEHIFCLDCITEWSKNVNTCPVDRATFNTIVVRACIGGRVLRTDPVTVVERPPSVDMLVIEDPTPCEICRSTSNEEVMLLCDNCDLGYHMDCLTPALHEIPDSQWFCPGCVSVFNAMGITEMEDMMLMNFEMTSASRSEGPMLRNLERMLRHQESENQPSTSSGRRSNRSHSDEVPTTSRGSRSSNRNISSTSAVRRRTAGTQRRKARRRKTRTVVIEYEVEENGKFPVTKRVKRKIKRRKTKKRQPRTVARRSHVRASVRAKLAASGVRSVRGERSQRAAAAAAPEVLRRAIAAPSLNLFGDPHQLDYFSDDENDVSEGATAAVAARPTSSILTAYRQARRKLVSIPSPPHATSAPDILSNILESQTLLHSKNSIVSISVDGDVNIKLQGSRRDRPKASDDRKVDREERDGRVDLSKAGDSARKVPSYPGQSRGGGWGGGYRGNYHREQTSNNFSRGGTYDNSYGGANSGNGGGFQGRPGQGQGNPYPYQNNNMRREEPESFGNYTRRPHQYSHNEDLYDRSRRPPIEANRGPNYPNPNHQRLNELNQGRFSLGPAWQPYAGTAADSRTDGPPPPARHSFGGFENPLDMRMGQAPPIVPGSNAVDMYAGVQAPRPEKPQPYRPLPEPPSFDFNKIGDVDKSEDERSDPGLVIDTEKYDPTEPTNDDDSGDDEKMVAAPRPSQPSPAQPPQAPPAPASPPARASPPAAPAPPSPPSPRYAAVQSILAGIDTTTMNVPPNVLDTAVRQVLQEHRNLIGPSGVGSRPDKSDEDSDGDCPNFSIYSATSVHIANNTSSLPEEVSQPPPEDNLEDLVQEDDETPPPEVASPSDSVIAENSPICDEKKEIISNKVVSDVKKKTEEEYKEKVSKRCPITTNTRNPIKIKLNTPSLMKRSVSLYDDDDEANDEVEAIDKSEDKSEPVIDGPEDKSITRTPSPIKEQNDVTDQEENIVNSVKDDDDHQKDEINEEVIQKTEIVEEKTAEPDNVPDDIEQDISNEMMPDDPAEKQTENTAEDAKEEEKDTEPNDINLIRKDTDEELVSETEETKELENEHHSEAETDDVSADELLIKSPVKDDLKDNVEKLTESISENEDERSYTPCLDENKSKDNSFDTEKEKGIEGLDTEMISEEEGNEMFSENERPPSPESRASPPRAGDEDGEILDKKAKDDAKRSTREEGKKKKKKESKKEGKDKSKSKKKGDVAFKKLSKSGKERNYRERDKDEKKSKKERRESSETAEERQRRRREKRKDLERYDVRTVVTEKRKKMKDPFGRDISPRAHSPSLSPALSPARHSRSGTPPPRRSLSRRLRRSPSPLRRRSPSPLRRRSPSPLRRRSMSPLRRRSPSPVRRRSPSPIRRRSPSPPRRLRHSPSPRSATPPSTPRRSTSAKRRSPARKRRREPSPRRRRSASRARKRRRSADRSPKPKPTKKKKRARSERPPSRRRRKSPKRRRRRTASREPPPSPPRAWTPPSVDSRLLSPRTPPPEPSPPRRAAPDERPAKRKQRRRDPERRKRVRDAAGPSKEVFTSGDNILVSVSFKEQERAEDGERRKRREGKRERRRRRRPDPEADAAKPVAIIDLERSPFRELTPSPKNVIVLSDSDRGEPDEAAAPPAPAPEPAPEPAPHAAHPPHAAHAPHPAVGPKTPPSPAAAAASPPPEEPRAPAAPEPRSPDAYDPFEPTRSASASPAPAPSPPRHTHMTLEAAQKTNMSADEVLDRRPLSPMEKVLALLQSTRDVSPEPPPGEPEPPPAPRIVLPEPKPKLFPGKPSPIKSNPVKPMQQTATKIARAAPMTMDADSPYSPGSSDFGDLFEPPSSQGAPPKAQKLQSVFDALFDKPPKQRKGKSAAAKVPVKLNKKKGKTQVGVKIDEDNLKILDDLPSSAVEMQVKSKFLKKLNRQERVVEEVKLVLKPHYNKKHVTKEEYKDILRRAVPKICHNKTGEINPTKIQALVEAYVKKFRKKHKLGLA